MNKTLIIAAVSAAVVAGSMLPAQADTTLYGTLHESLDIIDNGTSQHSYVSSNSSRFGFKGSEDLGGGLKSIYQVESGSFAMDTGDKGLGGTLRNTFLGMTGAFGTVKVGRHNTPFKELARKIDRFDEQMGDSRNVIGLGADVVSSPWDNRFNNMIRYESPNIAGISAVFAHTSNNGTEGPANASEPANSASVSWSAGGLFIGAAYEKHGLPAAPNLQSDEKGWRLVGDYNFGEFTFGALYEKLSSIEGADLMQATWGLAASGKFANNTVKFHYYTANELEGLDTGGLKETGGKMWALGVDHVFSKSTMLYVNYAKAINEKNAGAFDAVPPTQGWYSVASANGGHGESAIPAFGGKSVRGVSVGMIVKF